MIKYKFFFFLFIFFFIKLQLFAQNDSIPETDTFFLARQKGILGELGRSISHFPTHDIKPLKVKNEFITYKDYQIRKITIITLGINGDKHEAKIKEKHFINRWGERIHTDTHKEILAKNLFFKVGDKLNPALFADNEKYLREQSFFQEARIIISAVNKRTKEVDITVITKDIFSIGISLNGNFPQNLETGLSDDNFFGSGNRLGCKTYFDGARKTRIGFNSEYVQRNIKGSFASLSLGFTNYGTSIDNGPPQEQVVYAMIDRPLVSAYSAFTYNVSASSRTTNNMYNSDSLYDAKFNYTYRQLDSWLGYNLDAINRRQKNSSNRLRKLFGIRYLNRHFVDIPTDFKNNFSEKYADISGWLFNATLFEQDFFKTHYIYGFGRSEDLPEGFNVSLIGGFITKDGRHRNYYGFDAERNYITDRGSFTDITLRMGSFFNKGKMEDMDILMNLDHFTRIKKLNAIWSQRMYIRASITQQVNPVLNTPLQLSGAFGIPSFRNDGIFAADTRFTAKVESVFFNKWNLFGFKIAPFTSGEFCMIKPSEQRISKSEGYTAVSWGMRSRNENLIFGTIELKMSLFPRYNAGMSPFRIELNSNLQYKYNSQFVKKPDFIVVN